jgi:predicted peptidase
MKTSLLFAALWSASLLSAFPQSTGPMQTAHEFERQISRALRANYLLFLPQGYSEKAEQRWPVILFLHGAGERGTNLAQVKVHGPPKIVENKPDFPFIVISPQCPPGERWSPELLVHLLDDVIARHAIDTNRVYLTGLSMGGYGTWALGAAYPEKFAAIAPICGGGETIGILLSGREKRQWISTLGVWAFHGAKDPVVSLEESERMVNALKRAGCQDVKLTVYPEATHDSWTETYNNPELYEWFLKHSRARPANE